MSETTAPAERRLRDPSAQVEAVRQALAGRVEGARAAPLLDFATIFLGRAPDAFLRGRSAAELAALTLGAYGFLEGERPGRVGVSVSNPDMASEGWAARVTVVRANVTERPFIVDTIREFLHRQGLAIEHMVYPLLDVERDGAGRVTAVRPASDGGAKESLVHCEIERVGDPARRQYLATELTRRLQDVVRATDDFAPMLAALDAVGAELKDRVAPDAASADELAEIRAFLRWLRDGAFVFLGYRAYDLLGSAGSEASVLVRPGSGLGVLRNEAESRFAEAVPLSRLPANMRALAEHGPVLIINKSNAEATVHRAARMDYIGVKSLDAAGRVVGEHRFLGLFTSRAFAEAAENIPILRKKLARVLEGAGVRKGSHDYKAIITIFNSLPREELFVSTPEQIAADVRAVLTSYGTDEVRVTLRDDSLARGRSVMVILPRDRFSGDVRKLIEAKLLDAFGGEVLNYHLTLGEGDQARLHFYLSTTEDPRRVDTAAVEHAVRKIIRTWADLLEEGLERVRPVEEATALVRRYANAFDPEYRASTSPETAVADILELEAMQAEGRDTSVSLLNRAADIPVAGVTGATELKVTLTGERLVLSAFMPILEDLGLTVIAMNPFEVRREGEAEAMIYVFAVQDGERRPLDIEARGSLIAETVLAARAGDAISDPFNALVLTAGLHWREVDVIRGLAGYTFQVGSSRVDLQACKLEYSIVSPK